MEYIVTQKHILKNERYVTYNLRSWRLFVVDSNCVDIQVSVNPDEERISIVTFDDLHVIKVGDCISFPYESRVYKFYVQHIVIENSTLYLIETARTLSMSFIVPVLRLSQQEMGISYLMNSYLATDIYPNDVIGNYIYLLYKYVDEPEYLILETRLKNHPMFVKMFDPITDKTLFKFKIPLPFQNSVKLLIDGKYSKITDEMKRVILRYHEIGKNSDMGSILYRDPEFIKRLEQDLGVTLTNDMELHQKINIENETFRTKAIRG